MILLGFLVYIACMAGSVLALCHLNSKYEVIDRFDFPAAVLLSSVFWPLGLPLTAAYIVGVGLTKGRD